LSVVSRPSIASTMVVLREPGEVFLLCHSVGPDAISWVEQLDPLSLETLRRSPDLPGGPTWPGGLAAHADGSLIVVFGRHAHRLTSSLEVSATTTLPRDRPYNSFVVLPDGHLVTKDFAGALPGAAGGGRDQTSMPSQLLVLDPERLGIVASLDLPEPSIARLSADADDVYVVGDTSLLRVCWRGTALELDRSFVAPYRTMPGQTYGWDAVIDAGAAWFLDNGAGSERYTGTLRGAGTSTAPLHLVRVDLATAEVSLTEVCGLPGGLVANPPCVDPDRGVVVAYDSGNGVVVGFDIDDSGVTGRRWERHLDHGCHPVRNAHAGQIVLGDHDSATMSEHVVVLDIVTGDEIARAATGSPLQSVLFSTPGFDRDLYTCSFSTVSRVSVDPPPTATKLDAPWSIE
jgi:hypothetical protein